MHHVLRLKHFILILVVVLVLFTLGLLPGSAKAPSVTNKGCYEISIKLSLTGEFVGGYFEWRNFSYGSLPIQVGRPKSQVTLVGYVDEDHLLYLETLGGGAVVTSSAMLAIGTGSARHLEGIDAQRCWNTISDGRLNQNDLAALAVVYPASDGFDVWAVDPATNKGIFLFTAKQSEISAQLEKAVTSAENQLINQLNGVSLWALTSNECQLNYTSQDNQTRIFVFPCAG